MLVNEIELLAELPPSTRALIARLLLFITVLVLIIVFRRVLTWIIVRPLRRIARRTGFEQDEIILERMMLPIRLFVIAVAIAVGVALFEIGDSVDDFLLNVSRTILIIAVLTGIYRLVDLLAPTSVRLSRVTGISIDDSLLPFLRTGLKLVVIAVGLVIVLQEWDYDVSGLIAGLGLGGLALSLAAQDTIANLFGFMSIVSDNPFDIGEYIITPDAEGIVEHVGLRSTRIRRLDQAVVYLPNNKLASNPITNWSRLHKRRINYTLGVTYDATSGDVRVLLERIRTLLRDEELVETDSITVIFTEFGDSALNILVRAYVQIADWGEFHLYQEQMHMRIMDIVEQLNLSFAFPSMSLYVENLPPVVREQPEERPDPKLSPRERALKAGHVIRTEQKPETSDDPEENITNQQDEG